MENLFSARAFAKINLSLRIGPRAEDGYHSILSLFQSVSLWDDIALSWNSDWGETSISGAGKGKEESEVLVAGDFDCPRESTTLYKAAMLFLQRQGIRARLRISVDKGIPAKAGLGGGSADAAALLSLLNKAFNAGLNSGELVALGLAVGSDVPFFFRGGTALVHGRGELVETLPPLRALGILLICPSFGVSTAWAYNSLDSYRTEQHEVLTPGLLGKGSMGTVKREFIEALGRPLSCWKFKNDFSPLLYREYPVYKEIEALLRSMGAAFVSITGSGASIFGLFDSLENAREAKKRLLEEGRDRAARKLLYGMALHAIKPLETSLRLG